MKEQSITKGFFIITVGTIVSKVLSLLYIPFLNRILGDEAYGVYGSTYTVFTFIFVVANAGIPIALSKLMAENLAVGKYKEATKTFKIAKLLMVVLSAILTILMMIFCKTFALSTKSENADLAIFFIAPSIIVTSVSFTYRGYFQGRSNMTPTAISTVLEQVANVVFSLLFSYIFIGMGIRQGVAGATIGTTAGALISTIYLKYLYDKSKKTFVPKYSNKPDVASSTKHITKKLIKASLPLTICMGLTYAGNLIDVFNTKSRLLVAGFNATNVDIMYGYFFKYQQLINVPIAIVTGLCQTVLPAISYSIAKGEKDVAKDKVNYAFKLCFIITIPSAVGLATLAEPIYRLFAFKNGSYIMAAGAIVLVFMSIVQLQTTILQSLGKLYEATASTVLGVVIKIALNYYLIAIPEINIYGAIIGSVVGFLIPIVINQFVIIKSSRIKFSLIRHAIKPTLASVLMGALVTLIYSILRILINFIPLGEYVTNALATMIAIIIGVFVYLWGLIFLGGLRKDDFEVLPNKVYSLIPGFMRRKIRE